MAALLLPIAARGEEVPRPLVVPLELRAVTSNPEPSGVVWSPSRQRYLVVSDDAGLRQQGTQHAPWLLALAANGTFDRKPIPIRGVDRINDAESICAGPGGTYFLVTSHSPNHRGKTSVHRRQLLQLTDAQDGLVVAGRVALTDDDGGRALLGIAALPSDGRLDIEAIAYRDGALFVGLKGPLGAHDEAVIVRIAEPEQALRDGKLRASSVSRFAAIPLCVGEGQQRACQGISDMLFLADGSLVVAANAPKEGRPDHGGALWLLPTPVGQATPRLLQRFPGRKPEGVTGSAAGRTLVVIFDNGAQPPEWTEVPIPKR